MKLSEVIIKVDFDEKTPASRMQRTCYAYTHSKRAPVWRVRSFRAQLMAQTGTMVTVSVVQRQCTVADVRINHGVRTYVV